MQIEVTPTYKSWNSRRLSGNLDFRVYTEGDKSNLFLQSIFKKNKHNRMGRNKRIMSTTTQDKVHINTFPKLLSDEENLALMMARNEKTIEQQNSVLLKGKINHFDHEKEHCEQVLTCARKRYNSIVETRTQALNDKLQLSKKHEQFQKYKERRLSEIKARVSVQKSEHKTKVSSFRERIYTEAAELRRSKIEYSRIIERNLSNQSSKKKLQASFIRQSEEHSQRKKKEMMETRSSLGKSYRQEKIIKQWNQTKRYVKQNDKLYKKLVKKFEQYKSSAQKASKELDAMRDIIEVRGSLSGKHRIRDNISSSCSCYTNNTFLTKNENQT